MSQLSQIGRRIITVLSYRGFRVILALVLFIVLLSFAIVYHLLLPDTLVMTTGLEGGAYSVYGTRYQKILAREKVRLELLPSSGSVENLRRLADSSFRVDAGFVQDGTSSGSGAKNLVSLGAVGYSPLWVFYRSQETYEDLSRLRGKRISIGPEGSGVRKFAIDLLRASTALDPPTQLLDLSSAAAGQALLEGRVDAVMTFSTEDNVLVRQLLYSPKVKLMNFKQAEAYTRLFPALSHVVLPEGILDLSQKIPPGDIHLLAATTSLVVRKSLHPALIYLLLDAAVEIHRGAGWVNRRGEFPTPTERDFPSSNYAERFYKSGRPFLLDYLPFWMATFVDRMIFILVPLVVILVPALRSIPWLYSWRNRRKFYRWYGELKKLELEIAENPRSEKIIDYQGRIDQIEASINRMRVPLAFFDEIFRLKEHVNLVRGKLIQSGSPSRERLPHHDAEDPLR
jgi:TRAP-type uncharacterized transport system substrate-binding protein